MQSPPLTNEFTAFARRHGAAELCWLSWGGRRLILQAPLSDLTAKVIRESSARDFRGTSLTLSSSCLYR